MILFSPKDHIVVICSMVSISGLRTDGRYDKSFFSSTSLSFLSSSSPPLLFLLSLPLVLHFLTIKLTHLPNTLPATSQCSSQTL